ncbi:MAG: hypothetical protein Q8L99_08120 [Polycyclovorans sp.]|nr:hypothetical protein [Polycyclovorans sp.]
MRVLLADPSPQAQLSVELFAVRIARSIAAMATGIGEFEHVFFSRHRPSRAHRRASSRAWAGSACASSRQQRWSREDRLGVGPAIWNVAIDEARELAELALIWL